MTSQPTDKAEGLGEDFARGGQDKTPTQKKRNSYERTVVKADTPTVTVVKGNGQYSAPWIVESPGSTVATSAYNDGEKRCLSAEGGSGNPRKKVSEQNKTFPCQTATRSFLHVLTLRALFLPRAPHLQAASSREIVHLQTGKCGCQMGTKF